MIAKHPKCKRFKLASSAMFHTPGMVKWAQSGYRGRDRKVMVEVFVKGYGLKPEVVADLLSGAVPYRVTDDAAGVEPWRKDSVVVFDWPKGCDGQQRGRFS